MFLKILLKMRMTHVTPYALPFSRYPKYYKNQKLGNKMESNTKYSSAQDSKDIEIDLISTKV